MLIDEAKIDFFDSPTDHVGEGGVSRRQYTLKGVETEVIDLMRNAAGKDGMKIGSWVSARLKEAALRSLHDIPVTKLSGSAAATPGDENPILVAIFAKLDLIQASSEEKINRLEREIHEITRVQRTALAALLKSNK